MLSFLMSSSNKQAPITHVSVNPQSKQYFVNGRIVFRVTLPSLEKIVVSELSELDSITLDGLLKAVAKAAQLAGLARCSRVIGATPEPCHSENDFGYLAGVEYLNAESEWVKLMLPEASNITIQIGDLHTSCQGELFALYLRRRRFLGHRKQTGQTKGKEKEEPQFIEWSAAPVEARIPRDPDNRFDGPPAKKSAGVDHPVDNLAENGSGSCNGRDRSSGGPTVPALMRQSSSGHLEALCDIMKCPSCGIKPMFRPITLNCGHSICGSCCMSSESGYFDGGNLWFCDGESWLGSIECPTCRCRTSYDQRKSVSDVTGYNHVLDQLGYTLFPSQYDVSTEAHIGRWGYTTYINSLRFTTLVWSFFGAMMSRSLPEPTYLLPTSSLVDLYKLPALEILAKLKMLLSDSTSSELWDMATSCDPTKSKVNMRARSHCSNGDASAATSTAAPGCAPITTSDVATSKDLHEASTEAIDRDHPMARVVAENMATDYSPEELQMAFMVAVDLLYMPMGPQHEPERSLPGFIFSSDFNACFVYFPDGVDRSSSLPAETDRESLVMRLLPSSRLWYKALKILNFYTYMHSREDIEEEFIRSVLDEILFHAVPVSGQAIPKGIVRSDSFSEIWRPREQSGWTEVCSVIPRAFATEPQKGCGWHPVELMRILTCAICAIDTSRNASA